MAIGQTDDCLSVVSRGIANAWLFLCVVEPLNTILMLP